MALNVKFLKGSSVGYAGLTTKNVDTFYYTTDDNNLYLGEIKLSNGADLTAAIGRITKNEEEIASLIVQLETLTGDGDGSIAKMITDAIGDLPTKVTTLIGQDSGKSVRTIANEELAAQLLSGKADADFKTLQELAAWLEDHPENVAEINLKITNLQTLIGTLPADTTATDVIAYIQEVINVEKVRAEAVEKDLDDRLKVIEEAVGEGGSVTSQITDAINALDADIKSAEVEAGKGIQVQIAEIDGKLTNVNVTGNFDNSYDTKGAASAAQAAAAEDATTKATTAETNAKAHADGLNTAMDARMQKVEADSTDAVKEVISGTANGTVKVDGEDVAVTGLGSAAYVDINAFEASGSAATAEQNAKDYTDEALTWGSF